MITEASHVLVLSGLRQKGSNNANKNIPRQKPLIADALPEIASEVMAWHDGTLNIHLEKLLLVARPDYVAFVDWAPKQDANAGGELFWLVRCKLEIMKLQQTVDAFIY